MKDVLRELDALDLAVYRAIAATPTPSLDVALGRLSNAANYSRLWLGVAGGLSLFGRHGRRSAVLGLASIGLASATVNVGAKRLRPRTRPDRLAAGVPSARQVRMPHSTSFPSGHSASAFAFAVAAGDELPLLSFPLLVLAASVAYSRVHTGVHYPGDVVIGSLIGSACAGAVRAAARRSWRRSTGGDVPQP
jgi:undecaprenyl-diphosphatase